MQISEEKIKKLIVSNLPYLLLAYIFARMASLYVSCSGTRLEAAAYSLLNFPAVFRPPFFEMTSGNLLFGIIMAVLFKLVYMTSIVRNKKFRKGIEYGSARWGTEADIRPYMDAKYFENIILSQSEMLTMKEQLPDPKYERNKNVLIVGGSGQGKTFRYGAPNLMQLHSSYVYTDTKGTTILKVGRLFQRAGYKIKILNIVNFKKSMHYNPFVYIKSEKDIIKFANALIANTTNKNAMTNDPFWEAAEKLVYSALIGYIYYEGLPEEQNINTLMELIDSIEIREDDENFKNAVDLLFEDLERENPKHFAVRQWRKFRIAAGKTAKSILATIGSRLSPFDIEEIRELMSYDELDLDKLGDQKMAFFVITSDTDKTFNFIPALIYTQLFNLLCTKADDEYDGELPVPVRFILDEFANIVIPDFEILISAIRSRRVSASVIVQTKSQLKAIYKEHAETIEGNCDSMVFLGGKEKTTLKDIEEALGSETVDLFNESENRSNMKSFGINYNKIGRKLMSMDEIGIMPRDECIVQITGLRPFRSKKYDTRKHPLFKYTAYSNKKNRFDIEKYLAQEETRNIKFQKNDEVYIMHTDDAVM